MRTSKKIVASCIGFSFFILIFSNCGGSKSDDSKNSFELNPPFTIIESYSQEWVSGLPAGGSGVNVHILFGEISSDVIIENVYFKKKIIPVKNSPNSKNQYTGYFKFDKNRVVIMDGNPVKESQNTPPLIFPFNLADNEAVVSFLQLGVRKYFKISNMKQKELLAYPVSNPNRSDN